MSEEQEWHFISVVDGQQYGPYNAEQLLGFVTSGALTRETLVWTESLEGWIAAGEVEGLFPEQTVPTRPRLLTGADAQSARPLGSTTATPQQPAYQQAPPASQVNPAMSYHQQSSPAMTGSAVPGVTPGAAAAGGSPFPGPHALGMQGVPHGEPFPAPNAMKASFGLLLTLYLLAVAALVGAVLAAGGRVFFYAQSGSEAAADVQEAATESMALFLGGLGLGAVFFVAYYILSLVYLFRAWKAIEPARPRTTPGKAVGFLFIPFFNLYWLFVAYFGLANDWNRVMASHPNLVQAPRLNEGLFVTYCIVVVVALPFFLIPPDLMGGPIGFIVGLAALSRAIFELIVLHAICRGVNFMGSLHLAAMRAQQPAMGLQLY